VSNNTLMEELYEAPITNTSDSIEDEAASEQSTPEVLDIKEDERRIIWQAKDFSIREFSSMALDGELTIKPDYQRNFVASPAISSRLIESILMDVPIPVIYLAQERDGTFSVIDGQQRLTSFLSFVDGKYPNGDEFRLAGLTVLTELNRKVFGQLSKELQTKIRTTTIHSIIIKKESNEDIKFEIFERLNTGSTKLNEDEIRNTVYRGAYIKLLAELADEPVFHDLVRKETFRNRMVYRGMILRFLALSEKSYLNYKSSMMQFCNKELRDNQHLAPAKAKEYKQRFSHCLDLVKTVFGSRAFRRYIPGNEAGAGRWSDGQINMALFDMQMVGFVNYSKNDVLRNADFIRDGVLDLMTNSDEFQLLIGYKTSDTDNVRRRFRMYYDMLERVIGDATYSQRTFSLQLKEKLFKENPVCAISGQQILAIEDSEVDHIIPYSKGGPTTPENAQLVLRYFNRAKKDKLKVQV
jgi:hypothetical protein